MEHFEDEKYTLFDVPIEILLRIIHSIELEDILNLSLSCTYFNKLFKSEDFWEKLYRLHFSDNYSKLPFMNNIDMLWKFKYIRTHTIHDNWIHGNLKKITISPDIFLPIKNLKLSDNTLAYSTGCLINFVDVDRMKFSYIFRKKSKGNIKSFDYDNGLLFYMDGSDYDRLFLYKTGDKKPKAVRVMSDSISSILYDKSSNVLVTGGNSIKLWSLENFKNPILKISYTNGQVSQLKKKDNYLFTCMKGRTIRIFDIRTKEKICSLRGHTGLIRCLSTNGDMLASSSRDETIRLWDFRNSRKSIEILNTYDSKVLSIDIDQWKLVSGSKNGNLSMWDLKDMGIFYQSNIKKPIFSLIMDQSHLYIGSTVLNVYDYTRIMKKNKNCIVS